MSLKKFFTSSFDFSIYEYELKTRTMALNAMLLVLATILPIMTVVRFMNDHPYQGTVNLIFSILSFSALFWMKKNKDGSVVVAHLTCVFGWMLTSALFLNVPEDTLRIAWFFALLPPTFFLCSTKFGIFISLLSLLTVIIGHTFGNSGYSNYDILYYSNLSFLITIFLLFYEYNSTQHKQRLELYSMELEERVKERTSALQREQKRMQAITENIPGVVFQFYTKNSGEAGLHYASPKLFEIFGLELINNPPLFLQTFVQNIHEEDRQSWMNSVQNALKKQIPWKWQGRYVKPSGKIIWFEGQSIPTVRKDEIIFDGIFIDITDKIEQEAHRLETARQQEQFKKFKSLKTMAGAIAHRFNNAIMAVQSNLELMMLTLPDDSKEQQMALDATQAVQGATEIGSMMLSYIGQKPPQLKELSFSDLVINSVLAFKRHVQPSTILKFTPPDEPCYCSLDQQQIKEVIESILTNAVESLDNGSGTIKITFGTEYFTTDSFPICFESDSTLKDGNYVFCQIKDSGHGISPEKISQIFEPFYTTKFVGRGLGLALTVGIMQTHHGAITVKSSLDKGTTVRVLLPAISSPQQTISLSDDVQSEPVQLSGDILLADDEPLILMSLKAMLEGFGFTVHTAVNGQWAVNMLHKQNIDFCAAVLDISMPVMDGIEAMKRIRKIKPGMPILLNSGYSENSFSFQEEQGGRPDCFMRKPFHVSDMKKSLEKLLS